MNITEFPILVEIILLFFILLGAWVFLKYLYLEMIKIVDYFGGLIKFYYEYTLNHSTKISKDSQRDLFTLFEYKSYLNSDDLELLIEKLTWIQENCQYGIRFQSDSLFTSSRGREYEFRIRFSHTDDAVKFKLMWGE